MKTKLTTLAVVLPLLFAITIQSQKKPLKILSTYDRFKDSTTVFIDHQDIKGTSLTFTVYFIHAEKELREPIEQLGFAFYSLSSDWKFLRQSDRELFVIADGERIKFTDATRDSSVLSGRSVQEQLIFTIPRSEYRKIAAAKTIEMRLGTEIFSLKEPLIDAMREIESRMGKR